ncbi:hypothetical protein PPROV_000881800 [Pycnococcus provasolii]|uniref:G-protein coupled receptors family 3 profile domain-containing protein n=1 Tax=Pycnococcus provasolii TaxID=41880 RepID=A0A830HTQ6_9CHLO|nr:hypothetical protein PPROV_000881800 [Pycnococcus provasolii]
MAAAVAQVVVDAADLALSASGYHDQSRSLVSSSSQGQPVSSSPSSPPPSPLAGVSSFPPPRYYAPFTPETIQGFDWGTVYELMAKVLLVSATTTAMLTIVFTIRRRRRQPLRAQAPWLLAAQVLGAWLMASHVLLAFAFLPNPNTWCDVSRMLASTYYVLLDVPLALRTWRLVHVFFFPDAAVLTTVDPSKRRRRTSPVSESRLCLYLLLSVAASCLYASQVDGIAALRPESGCRRNFLLPWWPLMHLAETCVFAYMVVDGVVDGTGTPLCSNRATHSDKDEATAKINEELEAEAISLKAKLQNVESLLASRNSSIEGLQAACAESDKAAADARRDYNKATSELKWQTEKIDKLTKDHAHMKSEVEKLHEKIKATEEGASADEFLSERNRHLEHEMESMRVKIEKLAQLKDKEHAMQQDTNEEALQMEKKFNEATSRMRTLEEKLAQAESESARLAEEKARVDSKLDAANKLLDESRGDKPVDEAIKNSSEAIQAENEELKVKLSALEIDIKRTKEDLDSARLTAMKMTAKAAASNMAAEVAVSKIASAESEMQRMLHSSATHSQGSQTDAAEAMQADLPKVEEMMQDSSTGAGLEKNSGDALQAVILWWHSMTSAEASSGHPQMWLAAEDKVYGASIAKMEASMSLASELFPNHKDMSGTFLAYISDIPKASRGDLIVGGEGTIRTAMHENFATFLPEGGKEKADRALESVSDAPATMRAYLTGTVSLGVGKNGKLMIAIPIIAPPLNSGESCNVIGVVTTAPETADGQVPRRKHMDEAKADAAFLALIRGLSNFAGGYGRAAGKIESEDAARIEKTLASMESLDSFSLDLHESLDRQSTEEMQQIVSAAEVGGEEVLEMYVEDAEQLKPAADAKEEESGLASTPLEEEKVLEEKVVDEKKKMLARVESTKELSEVRVKALINLSKVRAANTVLVDMMYQRAQLSQQIMLLLDVIEQSKSLNNALKEIRVYRKVSPLIARMLCAFLILLQPKDEAIFATLPLPEDATPLDESGNVMSCYGFPSHENGVHVVWMVLQRHLKRLGGTITKKLTKMARSVRCPSELSPDDPMLPYAQRSFTTCEALLESFTEAELNKASRALPVIHRFVKALLKRGHVAEKIRALNSFMSDGKGSSPPPIIRTSSIDPQKFVKSMSTKMLMETMITSGEILKESRDEIAKEFAKDGVGSSASVFKARNKNAEVFIPPGP